MDQVRRSGATVVSQPGFIYWQGSEYNDRVAPGLWPHLYPVGELTRAGVPIAFGSDAPVIDPNPWPGIYAAVTRSTRSGNNHDGVGPSRAVTLEQALSMYTRAGARSEGTQGLKGDIQPGKLADLVLLDKNPFQIETEELPAVKPVLTILGGRVVWEL